jgi:hypothetical protein
MAFSSICNPCNPQTKVVVAFLLVITSQRKTSVAIYTYCMCNNHIRNVKLQSPHHIYSTPTATIQQTHDNINHKISKSTFPKVPSFFQIISQIFLCMCLTISHDATLTLSSYQSKGLQSCEPKVKPESHISYSQECRRVWGNEPSHSQVGSHFGSWIPNGLLNFQKAILRVKTHWIEEFFIPLESSWNIYV